MVMENTFGAMEVHTKVSLRKDSETEREPGENHTTLLLTYTKDSS